MLQEDGLTLITVIELSASNKIIISFIISVVFFIVFLFTAS